MKPLWEISEEYLRLLNAIEEYSERNGGEIPQDLEAKLDAVVSDRLQKLQNCCSLLKEFEARSEYVASALKLLQTRKKAQDSAADRLRAYIAKNVQPGERLQAGIHKIGWRKSEVFELLPNVQPENVPPCYQKITIDIAGAKSDAKSGADVWFGQLVEKQNIQIG